MANISNPDPPPLPNQPDLAGPSGRKKWRFGLRTLLIVMTGVACFFGMLVILPSSLTGILIGAAWLAASGWTIMGILYGRGDTRAFCIGVSIVLASMWTGIGGQFLAAAESIAFHVAEATSSVEGFRESRILLKHLVMFLSAMANGWLCVRARKYFEEG